MRRLVLPPHLLQRIADLLMFLSIGSFHIIRVRHDPMAQVWVADEPDASLGPWLADHEGFDRRFSPVGFGRENPRIERGTGQAGDGAPLADWRQAQELAPVRVKVGFTRRNLHRTEQFYFISWGHFQMREVNPMTSAHMKFSLGTLSPQTRHGVQLWKYSKQRELWLPFLTRIGFLPIQ